MKNNHIVYAAFDANDVCLYVGEGKPDRYKHITSGVSHVYEANKWHFKNKFIRVEILHSGLTKELSVAIEKEEINKRNPSWNKAENISKGFIEMQNYAVQRLVSFIDKNPKFKTKKHNYTNLVKDMCKLLNNNGETTVLSSQKWTDVVPSKNLTSCLARREELSYLAIKHVFTVTKVGSGVYKVSLNGWLEDV